MKSIYRSDDLRCNEVGLDLIFEAENFFKAMMEKYPEHDPREMLGLFLGQFEQLSDRRILDLRRSGILSRREEK